MAFSFHRISADFMALLKNDLSGTIPTEFGLLTNMTRLDIQQMHLEGTLPSEIGQMSLLSKYKWLGCRRLSTELFT